MGILISPNLWDDEYYPTAKVLVYEVEADKPTKIMFQNVIVRDLFPIHIFEDYMYRGSNSLLDPNDNAVRYKLDFVLMSTPKFGTIMYREGDGFYYQPRPGYIGLESIRYRLVIGERSSNIATIELFVGSQAKYPACSVTHAATSGTLSKTSGMKYPIHLCKPVFSSLGFRVSFSLKNFVGEVESEPPPYVPVPERKPVLNPDGTPVLDANGDPKFELVYPPEPPEWNPSVNDRTINFKIVNGEDVVYSGDYKFNALGFVPHNAFIDISVNKARLQNFDIQLTVPQEYSVDIDIAEFKTRLS